MSEARGQSGFETLRAMDRQFLVMEDENTRMHVSGFSVDELKPETCMGVRSLIQGKRCCAM